VFIRHTARAQASYLIITFVGISTSGALANVNAMITTTTWEPPPTHRLDPPDGFFQKHVEQYQKKLNLNLVTSHRPPVPHPPRLLKRRAPQMPFLSSGTPKAWSSRCEASHGLGATPAGIII
jgi:hypothetical protein